MFDANKGNQALTKQIDEKSDTFAMLFDGMTSGEQDVFLDKAIALLRNPDSVAAFNSGTYAQDSSGQPAKQLGGGSQPSISSNEALQILLADTNLDVGFKHLIRRGYDQTQRDHIPVEQDGTPTELKSTRTERDDAVSDKNAAEAALAEEKNPNKSGSLAHQLAAAKANPATPADSLPKADVKTAAEKALAKVQAVKASPMKGGASSKTEAEEAVQAIIDSAS